MKFQWPINFRRETKASEVGQIIAASYAGMSIWSKRDYAKFSQEAYVKNAVGYRCVKLIAGNAAAVKFILYDKNNEIIPEHPILKLLSHPNPANGGSALFEEFYSFFLLAGNAYIEEVRSSPNSMPVELWGHRPDRMKIVPGALGIPKRYEFDLGGNRAIWRVDQVTGQSDILHVKDFNPTDDWYGLSRIEPAAFGVDRHNAASAHNKALLDNGARPTGALIFEPVKTPDGTVTAPQEVIDAAQKKMSEHTGPAAAGIPFVMGGEIKWIDMGITPRDMDFSAGKDDAARDICTAIGVPHMLIVPGSATYNNIREAKLELWEQTIFPMLDKTIDEINNWLVPQYGDGLRLEVDKDAISDLEPRRESKRKSTVELLAAGVIDINEARDDLQYGLRPDDAVGKVDATVLTALIAGIDTIGFDPLIRYAKSVGLFTPDMSEQQIIDAATAYLDQTTGTKP